MAPSPRDRRCLHGDARPAPPPHTRTPGGHPRSGRERGDGGSIARCGAGGSAGMALRYPRCDGSAARPGHSPAGAARTAEPRGQPVPGGWRRHHPGLAAGATPRAGPQRPSAGLAAPGQDKMEPFYFSDLGLLTENKAMERILCPMAAQLCHLILALEWEDGICPDIEENAETLAQATEELAAVARRLAEESSDEVLEEEMCPAAQSLVLAGSKVLVAARRLRGQPDSPGPREELAAAAQRVLMETAKILQMEDAAGVRRILQAASWLLECLSVLQAAADTPAVLAAFQAFSEALLLLSSLTAKRLEELGDCPRQKSLAQTLQLLQQRVPLLHAAKDKHLKHSRDQQVSCSKDDAFQLVERTIKELMSLLTDDTGSKEPWDRSGTFSEHVSRLLALLSPPDPLLLSDSTFSAHVGAVVFHCMLLAEASRPHQRLDLVRRCWVLLRLRKSICSLAGQQERGPGLEGECHSMRQEVQDLDQVVLAATLCQVLDTFPGGKEPLRLLVEGALSLAAPGCFPAGQGGFLKQLQPLIAAFFTHAQGMLRAADFVLARCPKPHTAGDIRELVQHLRRLLASVPPLLAAVSRDGAQASAAEQLQSLCHAWAGAAQSLLWCFEDTVSTREFLKLSIREMAKEREWCERALGSQDPERFSWHTTHLSSWARWVVEATTRYVDRATDPIFRNGLLVWVEQLASSILELKAAAALCAERPSCPQTRDVFSKAASCLMDAAQRVQDGLDGSNHPDILSPLREQVRGAPFAKGVELSPSCAGLKTIMDEAVLQEDTLSHPSSQAGSSHPRKGGAHPVITALLAARGAHDTPLLSAACSALLELSRGCVDAAKEALSLAECPHRETLGQYQEIELLTPRVISLARDTAPEQRPCPSELFHVALTLSERICHTKECLAAVAGSWYSLSQQVFVFILSADFLRGKQALEETMMGLAGAVQFAADIVSITCREGSPLSPDGWGSFLQVQAKFSRARMITRALLGKAASFEGSSVVGRASLELLCVQWAVSAHVLLGAVDRFLGRDVLLLRELRSAVRNKLCPQSLLAALSERSLRLQEAARLSSSSCPEGHGHTEILVLREEMQVLMEALLEASSTLLLSPLPAASLCVRFELLQRDLALRAKALLLHLERVNAEHLRVIRDVVGPALTPLSQEERERSKEAFEEKAKRLMANVQWVKTTLHHVLEANTQPELEANLLSIADHLLLLTSNAVGSARQLLQSHQGEEHLHLESTVWYWSAEAHYLVTQLQAVQGIGGDVVELIKHCLQNTGDQSFPGHHHSTAKLFPALELDALSHARSAETCASRSGRARGAAREAPARHRKGPPSTSPASSPVKHERESSDTGQGGPSKMSQVTKDMATRMRHMTQFLKKKGPITSKDQLVACARQMALDGQEFVTFGRAVAKLCLDRRCSMELLCATEQAHTISSQLGIVARVKAVTAESKSSSELLVSNTQNLVQAVLHILKAAEAACIKGLCQPTPDSEEAAAAAFCMQWRRNLLLHRAKESFTSDRDELGLRRTGASAEPSLVAMVQEQAPHTKDTPKHPKPGLGCTVMGGHL
ncbi:uncharacterized protein LOC115610126 [Strigops habroptila]|uniref:uncharacterized protein LOC115610126 n=1 Tax=Strigops habroptila TaxID=2489341 RepID=UPI0011CF38A7|nr:uncharacterized protein LOC115610126 [Strigops habroptila]